MLKKLVAFTSLIAFQLLAFATAFAEDLPESCKIDSYEDMFVWGALDFPDKFDPSTMEKQKKEEALIKGVELYENTATEGSVGAMAVLAIYYSYTKKETKKGLYWALSGALKGNEMCMHVLGCAYINGDGVVEDHTEGIKWLFLASACGDKTSIEKIKNLKKAQSDNNQIEKIMNEARTKAKAWQEAHPEAFFSP